MKIIGGMQQSVFRLWMISIFWVKSFFDEIGAGAHFYILARQTLFSWVKLVCER